MGFKRARVVVSYECDLDAVPGWGHTPTDGWTQLFTDAALRQTHYNVTAEVLRIDEMRKEFVDGEGWKAPKFPPLALSAPTTQAPGYAGHSGAHSWRAEFCDDGTWMACTVGDVIASGLTEANARLIAAAPDMYEALLRMQQHWHHMIGLTSPTSFHALNAKAESALAKAEGRADA